MMPEPTAASATVDSRLLGVWPHPDDEAYLSAGFMARLTDVGGHVTALTMTRGEKGTSDPVDYDQPHFGARREDELRASLGSLGVHDVRFGPYRDGECDLVDPEEAIAMIVDTIRSVTPTLVVTFGPDGITGHRDHRLVSAWVTEAVRRVPGTELAYATMGTDFIARHAELHARIGIFDDYASQDLPASFSAEEMAFEVRLSEPELDRKRRALAHHASQTTGLAELMGEETYRSWWSTEYFRSPTPAEWGLCPVPLREVTRAEVSA